MKLSPHYLKRYKDITLLLLKYGRPAMTSRFAFEQPSPITAPNGHDAEELPNDLERLGPTFVKLGQLLSSRADLVPEYYLKPLSRLQDKVTPFPWQDVEFTIEKELGAKISKLFCLFEREPMAAASLGQVHRAALHDGRPVAVKVQRPNISSQITDDFAALEQIAQFLHRHTSFGRRFQVRQVLDEFKNTLARELDYEREAANMITLANNLKEF